MRLAVSAVTVAAGVTAPGGTSGVTGRFPVRGGGGGRAGPGSPGGGGAGGGGGPPPARSGHDPADYEGPVPEVQEAELGHEGGGIRASGRPEVQERPPEEQIRPLARRARGQAGGG